MGVSVAVGGNRGGRTGGWSEAPAPRIPYPYLSTPALDRVALSPVNEETLHLAAQP